MSKEFVILVDEDDNPIGVEEKVRCHMPDGLLHRAFTALLFDSTGRLVLGRRASTKMLWPGHWDGTFASHPRTNETYISSGQRRMPEELGVKELPLKYMHKFEYHVPYLDIGSENEICATLIGVINNTNKITKAKDEIDEIKTMSSKMLFADIELEPDKYCPWMLIAIKLLDKSDNTILTEYSDILSEWINKDAHNILDKAIKTHLPNDRWRILNG